jgi:flagellar basal body-associated protein FliL
LLLLVVVVAVVMVVVVVVVVVAVVVVMVFTLSLLLFPLKHTVTTQRSAIEHTKFNKKLDYTYPVPQFEKVVVNTLNFEPLNNKMFL